MVEHMRCPDKGVGDLVDDVACVASKRVDFDNTKSLMTAIDLLVPYVASVGSPAQFGPTKIDKSDVRFLVSPFGDIKPVQFMRRELVAGQWISALVKFCPAAVLR